MSEYDLGVKSEYENFRNNELLQVTKLQTQAVLKRDYLSVLKEFEVAKLPLEELKEIHIGEQACFYDVTKLVYTKEENYLEKLTTIVNTAYVAEASLVTAIICDASKTRYLIGIVKKSEITDKSPYGDSLEGAVKGNFPGSVLDVVMSDSGNDNEGNHEDGTMEKMLADFAEYKVVSAISNIPSERREDGKAEEYIQGIEKLVDSIGNEKYCILTIADPISQLDCSAAKNALSELYRQLSGFVKTEVSVNENYSVAESETITESFAKSIGTNTSVSQTHTSQTGWSESISDGNSKDTSAATMAKLVGVGATLVAGLALAPVTGGASIPTTAVVATAVVAGSGAASGAFGTKNHTETRAENSSTSDAKTEQHGTSETDTNTTSTAKGNTNTKGEGKTLSFSIEDKVVKNILDEIDKQLERINKCSCYGAFNTCTYVLSENIDTNMLASNLFNALITGEQSGIQNSKVNIWGKEDDVKDIIRYLQKLTHPVFKSDEMATGYTASSMISGKELAIQMGFPKKSISGLSVVYKVPFGRNVIRAGKSDKTVDVGKIYHMGQTTKEEVKLDLKSLTSHVFITGSTGTGKSNAVYEIMKNIKKADENIHFLVVEPAKGEYKHIFKDECHVYGTNPKKSDLLRINPFSFPDDIHVLEHIDRIVEIMNVCWPMYAAMPAILKNAVIKSYEKCGWDLINSCVLNEEKIYPNFADVLSNIYEILESSAFSQDNKGDYIGALCTRVESLTYGLNGQIFTSNEVTNEELFDENVIVDLSRVEPADNKALIMGMLVMKLQEYRLSEESEPNQPLKHVVVLEEAHNILKKTSTDQTMEGSNLAGKSVEMLTNAIAEMRTYGESFFIVDQAPDLLDRAVIRNTNTKIVFRLPDDEDRKLVGHAMALSDEQIQELSKLEVGCAAIYQNDWEEAVLCQFEEFKKASDGLFEYPSFEKIRTEIEVKEDVFREVMDVVCKHEIDDVRLKKAKEELKNLQIDIELKRRLKHILDGESQCEFRDVAPFVVRLFDCGNAIEKCRDSSDIEDWNKNIIMAVNPELINLPMWYRNTFIQCLMIEQTRKNPEFTEYADAWKAEMEVK